MECGNRLLVTEKLVGSHYTGWMQRASTLLVRPALPADIGALMAMIHGLGQHQAEPAAVVGDERQLAQHLFGPRPAAEALVGLVEDHIAGFALFHLGFSVYLTQPTLYLADLFVLPERRGVGLGKALLNQVAAVAVARGYQRLEFTVMDGNRVAIAFYEALGADARPGWTNYRFADEALAALAAPVRGEPA
jgi:GNAT superfamily N-acetyltransferase